MGRTHPIPSPTHPIPFHTHPQPIPSRFAWVKRKFGFTIERLALWHPSVPPDPTIGIPSPSHPIPQRWSSVEAEESEGEEEAGRGGAGSCTSYRGATQVYVWVDHCEAPRGAPCAAIAFIHHASSRILAEMPQLIAPESDAATI